MRKTYIRIAGPTAISAEGNNFFTSPKSEGLKSNFSRTPRRGRGRRTELYFFLAATVIRLWFNLEKQIFECETLVIGIAETSSADWIPSRDGAPTTWIGRSLAPRYFVWFLLQISAVSSTYYLHVAMVCFENVGCHQPIIKLSITDSFFLKARP